MGQSGNILFCGVGGQGILLASEVTVFALLAAGYDAKKSEVHGMAQRGGSVEAHLRYGKKVFSPLIEPATADYLVSFERMEAVRYLPYLTRKSKVIVNTHTIPPPAVATGKMEYPDAILSELTGRGIDVIEVDGFGIARAAGDIRAANVALVGALSSVLPVPEEYFLQVINTKLPEKIRALNLRVFSEGRKSAQ